MASLDTTLSIVVKKIVFLVCSNMKHLIIVCLEHLTHIAYYLLFVFVLPFSYICQYEW